MFKLYFLTSVADVVASVTLNYQLIRNSLEFENLFFCSTLSEFENFLLCERILMNLTTCQNETSS
jgi:hypothetical protein